MTTLRRQRLDPRVHRRLFTVATDAFVRDGYERASLNAILAESGVGKSTFFYRFADKEDLFATLIEEALARIGARVGHVELPTRPRTFWRESAAIMAHWGEAAAREPGFIGLLRALQPLRRNASPRLATVMDAVRAVYRTLLVRGVELGVVRSDLSIDTLIALTDAVDLALDDDLHQRTSPLDDAALAAHRSRLFDVVHRIVRV